ncbi:DNA-binding protein [Streptomyces sp. NPDC056723]|uniref:DNA-binding protein n=1 Tax=Streptomyces sp. NPDC056723 TaxID=3345925 RepID=UPI0036B50000
MPSDKYLRYGRPQPPDDPNQEYMSVQETAFVLKISVDTARRRLKALGIVSKPGRSVVTSKRDRQRIHEFGRKNAKEQGRVRQLRSRETASLPTAA